MNTDTKAKPETIRHFNVGDRIFHKNMGFGTVGTETYESMKGTVTRNLAIMDNGDRPGDARFTIA